MYSTPQILKGKQAKFNSKVPSSGQIVSSIRSFNYNLFSSLCDMLAPFISTDYCTQDSLSFVQEVSVSDYFMISYDVRGLFTLAVDIMFDNTVSNFQSIKSRTE